MTPFLKLKRYKMANLEEDPFLALDPPPLAKTRNMAISDMCMTSFYMML